MASPVNTGSVFSPAPIRTNFLNPDGSVSDIWVRWLNSLYNHVASTTPNTSTSILDVQLQSIMDSQSVPVDKILSSISDLEKLVILIQNQGLQLPDNAGGGFIWNEITTVSTALEIGNGYIMNNSSLVTGTLPVIAPQGAEIAIVGKGAGGWSIAQNSSQVIHFGDQASTAGIGGSIASQNSFDTLELLCTTANTNWTVRNAQGNLTVS